MQSPNESQRFALQCVSCGTSTYMTFPPIPDDWAGPLNGLAFFLRRKAGHAIDLTNPLSLLGPNAGAIAAAIVVRCQRCETMDPELRALQDEARAALAPAGK